MNNNNNRIGSRNTIFSSSGTTTSTPPSSSTTPIPPLGFGHLYSRWALAINPTRTKRKLHANVTDCITVPQTLVCSTRISSRRRGLSHPVRFQRSPQSTLRCSHPPTPSLTSHSFAVYFFCFIPYTWRLHEEFSSAEASSDDDGSSLFPLLFL